MSEIGAVVGFLVLMALLWSRISAERRQEEREERLTAKASYRPLLAVATSSRHRRRGNLGRADQTNKKLNLSQSPGSNR